MAKPHRTLKKANKGQRPANSKARRGKRGKVKTWSCRDFSDLPVHTRSRWNQSPWNPNEIEPDWSWPAGSFCFRILFQDLSHGGPDFNRGCTATRAVCSVVSRHSRRI